MEELSISDVTCSGGNVMNVSCSSKSCALDNISGRQSATAHISGFSVKTGCNDVIQKSTRVYQSPSSMCGDFDDDFEPMPSCKYSKYEVL